MPEPIPYAQELQWKEKFIERYSQLTDFQKFKQYSTSWMRKSIRVNTLKISVPALKKRLEKDWKLDPIPWCREGFWIAGERRDIGNLPEHMLGYVYVQEAASMIPPLVLEPKPGEIILDMAASPGSKATQIGQMMESKGLLIANDVTGDRLASLGLNVQRCGLTNVVVTQMQGYRIKDLQFDRILLDAPCSGTGTIRKSLKTIQIWNPNMVRRISGLQKKLIAAAFPLLKEDGILVYSTCTMEPEENEGVVDFLLQQFDDAKLEKIAIPGLKHSPAIMEFEGKEFNPEIKKCLRIWPQDNDTEGFFVAKIRKTI